MIRTDFATESTENTEKLQIKNSVFLTYHLSLTSTSLPRPVESLWVERQARRGSVESWLQISFTYNFSLCSLCPLTSTSSVESWLTFSPKCASGFNRFRKKIKKSYFPLLLTLQGFIISLCVLCVLCALCG